MSVGAARIDSDTAALIAAARARGEQRFDPVRFHVIEAMARRVAAHDEVTRFVIEGRIRELLSSYRAAHDAAGPTAASGKASPPTSRRGPTASTRGPLATLLDHLPRPTSNSSESGSGMAHDTPATPTLKALAHVRRTWSRLSVERRLNQSFAKLPENAGPLNSHQLVHRALTLMREVSPAYLERFMAQLDDLFWLDDALKERPRAAPRRDRPAGPAP